MQQVGHPTNGIVTLAIVPTRWFRQILVLLVRKHQWAFHTVDCGLNIFVIISPEIGEDGPVLSHIFEK